MKRDQEIYLPHLSLSHLERHIVIHLSRTYFTSTFFKHFFCWRLGFRFTRSIQTMKLRERMQSNVAVSDMISWIFMLNIASLGHQRRRKVMKGGPLDHPLVFDLGFRLDRAYESPQQIRGDAQKNWCGYLLVI